MANLKILLFGSQGQLGWELDRSLQCLGKVFAYDYPEIDFTRPESVEGLIRKLGPEIVINAAAYTDVDKAETEAERARVINAVAPGRLAKACSELGAAFIHFSTDYVFDGKKGSPYLEEDPPHPLNVYGRTKLEGEQMILGGEGTNIIFRTAWVYSLRRESFVTKVIHWARTQPSMRIVDDQVSNPTWARALAEITALFLARAGNQPLPWLAEHAGLYHIAGRGFASRFEWANEILVNFPDTMINRRPKGLILPAKSAEFCSLSSRPPFSALNCNKFEELFRLRLPDWECALRLAIDKHRDI